jgi:hypothetical protein
VHTLETDEWKQRLDQWKERAIAHYKICKHPHQNVFRQFFPEEAQAIRGDVGPTR